MVHLSQKLKKLELLLICGAVGTVPPVDSSLELKSSRAVASVTTPQDSIITAQEVIERTSCQQPQAPSVWTRHPWVIVVLALFAI